MNVNDSKEILDNKDKGDIIDTIFALLLLLLFSVGIIMLEFFIYFYFD